MSAGDFVAALVKAAGGELVGRVRLQKIAYLLQQLDVEEAAGLEWDYHHFGPYSREVESDIIFANLYDVVREERRPRASDGALYSVFRLGDKAGKAAEPSEQMKRLVQRLKNENSVILELAATAHWLSEVEKVKDWKKEIESRKTWKVEEGRLEKAMKLLEELGLPPAVGRNRQAAAAGT